MLITFFTASLPPTVYEEGFQEINYPSFPIKERLQTTKLLKTFESEGINGRGNTVMQIFKNYIEKCIDTESIWYPSITREIPFLKIEPLVINLLKQSLDYFPNEYDSINKLCDTSIDLNTAENEKIKAELAVLPTLASGEILYPDPEFSREKLEDIDLT